VSNGLPSVFLALSAKRLLAECKEKTLRKENLKSKFKALNEFKSESF